MQTNHTAPKIGVFYDGNFLLHASNYYNYIHPQRRRLSVSGLHDFICQRVAEEEGAEPHRCRVCEAHYFRGRLNAADAAQRGSQLYHDRVFDDILMSEGVHTHYLPLRNIYGRKEERGTDVWLALEVHEMALQGKIDVAVLVVADTDYVPLVRKLIAMGVRVMLISWEFEYINDEGTRVVTKTSHELMNLAHYPVPMQEVIDCGLEQENQLIMNLFVSGEGRSSEDEESDNGPVARKSPTYDSSERFTSQVLSVKNGYGFIKYPNNNLFFHSLDVIEGDFTDIVPGDDVEFSIDKNDQGQDVAKQVKKIDISDGEDSFWNEIVYDEEEELLEEGGTEEKSKTKGKSKTK